MAFYPPNSGGGGGGMVIGDPVVGGSPGWILYIDQSGNLTGDPLATRDSVTKVTLLGREVSPTLIQGFEISDTLAGVLDGTVITTADFAQNTAGFVGIFDSTPFGGDTVNAGILAQDGIGNFQTLILSPDPLGGANLRGSITDGITEGRLNLAQDLAEIAWQDGTNQARIFANSNYAIIQWNVPGPDFGWGIDATGVALFNGTTPVYRMPMSVSGASAGDVMTYDGLGNVTFQPVASGSIGGSIVGQQIAYGTGIDTIGGSNGFTYDSTNLNFIQTIPTNNGNNGTTTSPLSFGAPIHSGGGLDDLTLSWDAANYGSKKYGGNLTVQISNAGSPDEFSWFYTGSYSETIGTGTNIPIVAGVPFVLNDIHGNKIAEITFANDTGHSNGETWNAGTSLATYDWGQTIQDTSAESYVTFRPVVGGFTVGASTDITGSLYGNATRLQIQDNIAELSLFAKRYLRMEAPGGDTIVLADMQNGVWSNYNVFKVRDLATGDAWFDANAVSKIIKSGDTQGSDTGTVFTVDVTSETLTGYTNGSFELRTTTNDLFFYATSASVVVGPNSSGNNTNLSIDDTNENIIANLDGLYRMQNTSGQTFFLANNNTSNPILTLGAVGYGNSTNAILSDTAEKFTFATGGTDRFIAYKDWTFIGGAVVHGSIQSYTSTGSVSINDNVSTLQYNPASVNATATITLPATSGGSGSIVTVVFGGTITSGNPVVTTLTWAAGVGNTLVASNLPATANAGDSVSFQKIGAFWYQINK